jgi:hypothetical protein
MRQHVIKGRGVPNSPPDHALQHYLDLDTGETYISRGDEYTEDWGKPLLTKEDLETALHEFEEVLSRNEGLNPISLLEVQERDGVRFVTVDLPDMAGRFVIVTDPTESQEPYEIRLTLPYNGTVRLGLETRLYNDTLAEPVVVSDDDVIKVAGSLGVRPAIQVNGVVTIKYIGTHGAVRKWLIHGNTSRDANASALMAENSQRLDGYTREEIITEARALANDAKRLVGIPGADYSTDLELDDAFGSISTAIDTITQKI